MRAIDKPQTWVVLIRVVGALAVVSIALLALMVTLISRGETRALQTWDDLFGTLESRLERYPQRAVNRQALELQRLTEQLGISLEPAAQHTHRHPEIDDPAYLEIRPAIQLYVRRQLENEQGTDAPPWPVAEFLEQRRNQIDAVRNYLIRNPAPYWARDIERVLVGGPNYNPPGHRNLHALLLADALASIAADNPSRALDDLEASWKFLQAIRHNIFINTHAIALRTMQQYAGVLRRVDQPGEEWYGRLDPAGFRVEALDALIHFGWVWAHVDDTIRTDPDVHIVRRFLGIAVRPYVQICEIQTMAQYRPNLEKLIALDYRCDRDLEQAGVSLDWPEPWWNRMTGQVAVSVRDYIDLWRRVEFDLEATRKWIDLRAAVRANGGAWPRTIAGIESSAVCPQDRWVYTLDEGGKADLRLSRSLDWPDTADALNLAYFLIR